MNISNWVDVLIYVLVAGVIVWGLLWLINQLPEPARTPGKVVVVIIAIIVLLKLLLRFV